ncbi:hypothetical protein [Actinoplanes sp. NPDC051411]|uniref:hypothetical protein n=1 Tax=Actinoplanes sp. NPDC051411 TaxID=3155522 RepID=UPI00341AB29B
MRDRQGGSNAGSGWPVLTLAEADYLFGAGTLYLLVTRVRWNAPQRHEDEVWYEVDGVEMTVDGRKVVPRTAVVRGSRLRTLPRNSRYLGP